MLSVSPRRPQAPQVVVSKPDADPEDFSRRLKISSSPRNTNAAPNKSPGIIHANKLFNPDTGDSRHTAEPEAMSGADSYAPRGGGPARQLFNHRKHDPVRFSVLARPPGGLNGRPTPSPQSSGGYVSASSTSSYASTQSSIFTLSSTTDGSSTGSAPHERKDQGNDAFAVQLKRIYRTITALEGKIANEDTAEEPREEAGRITLKGKGKETSDKDAEQQRWLKVIADHKL
jgi:protein SMG6